MPSAFNLQTTEKIDLPVALPQHSPLLIVVSGPAGVGKDATLKRMQEQGHPFHFLVTNTTRPKRDGEQDGVDYHFVSVDEFQGMVARDEFLEHANVYGNWYGNSRLDVRRSLAAGQDVIMRIDVQGAATIRRKVPGAIFIFLLAPNLAELERRLRARRSEDEARLQLRLNAAAREMQELPSFDYYVINFEDELDSTVSTIQAIIAAEKAKVRPRRIQV